MELLNLGKSHWKFVQVIEHRQKTDLAVRDLKLATKVDIKIRLRRIQEF